MYYINGHHKQYIYIPHKVETACRRLLSLSHLARAHTNIDCPIELIIREHNLEPKGKWLRPNSTNIKTITILARPGRTARGAYSVTTITQQQKTSKQTSTSPSANQRVGIGRGSILVNESTLWKQDNEAKSICTGARPAFWSMARRFYKH